MKTCQITVEIVEKPAYVVQEGKTYLGTRKKYSNDYLSPLNTFTYDLMYLADFQKHGIMGNVMMT